MAKIAIICDMHMQADPGCAQLAFLKRAVERMKQERIQTVLCLGDMTAFGSIKALKLYEEALKDFTHYDVIGNAEVRDSATAAYMEQYFGPVEFSAEGRTFFGLHTPYGEISSSDRERLQKIKDGDVVFFHHGPDRLEPESTQWLQALMAERSFLLLHGHRHKDEDRCIGRCRAVGFRGLDPDKAIGGYPCIHYLEVSDKGVTVEECAFPIDVEVLKDLRSHLGLSCVENRKDVQYATEHGVKYIELRCNGKDWTPDPELLPLLEKWRAETNGYLSVHMPNLRWKDGVLSGVEQWKQAEEYALLVKADGLTIHPPRVKISDMPVGGAVWNKMLALFVETAKAMPTKVKMGIENVHVSAKDDLAEQRPFGVVPEDVCAWIDAINGELGQPDRVGHVLDVGHARNNAIFASRYPVGVWQQIMGRRTVAYHIHQVHSTPDGMKNHNPIESWLAPSINYTSFFHNWEQGNLNHVPVFLEVKGAENFAKSVEAFDKLLSLPVYRKTCNCF